MSPEEFVNPATEGGSTDREDGCADCDTPNDGTWPYGSDVCLACWDRAEADEAEAETS